ncbi:MAG: response regulator [Endomicrobia bacterium]|nr:response regulator [Endomicrobiia bacterium]
MEKEKRLQLGLLKIGELAERANVPISTIKYYTDLGLLRVQEYMVGGFRLYNEKECLLRLKRIKEMIEQGYAIRDIKENIDKITILKILVIDDETEVHDFIADALKDLNNIEIKSVYDGFSAGMTVNEYLPDLIILDLLLPGIDGFKVCRNVKSNAKLKDVKILAVTGYDSPEHRQKIFNAGADDYLPKPIELNLFREKIKKLLNI